MFAYSISQNGLYSSIPYVFLAIATIFSGYLSDILRRNKLVTTTAIRKINTLLGEYTRCVFVPLT